MANGEREDVEQLATRLGMISRLSDADIEENFAREDALGDFGFRRSRTVLQDIVKYAGQLSGSNWGELPRRSLAELASRLGDVFETMGDMSQLAQRGRPALTKPKRDRLAATLAEQFVRLRSYADPLVRSDDRQDAGIRDASDEMRRILSEARRESSDILSDLRKKASGEMETAVRQASDKITHSVRELDEKRAEAERALEAVGDVASAVAVEHHAEVFEAAAKDHYKWSWVWLASAVVAAGSTIAAAVAMVLWWEVSGDFSKASNVQLVGAKGTVLVVGFFITTNLLRTYRSQAHLTVVNRHREHALRTFRAFVQGTDSAEVKDKILLEAAHSVFGQAATGLIDERGSREVELLDGVRTLVRPGGE